VTDLGRPIDPSNLRRAWRRIVAGAGVGHVRFHDLRHTHATLLLKQNVHPKVVSERLGHANIGITLDTYSHVLTGLQADAAAEFDRLLDIAPADEAATGEDVTDL
jgi:integrase